VLETAENLVAETACDKQVPIVILALPKHDDDYTSTPYQLAVAWAKERTVWYVSHPYTWLDFVRKRNDAALQKRWRATQKAVQSSDQYVAEYDEATKLYLLYLPLTLPINSLPPGKLYRYFSRINHHWVASTIRKMLKKEGIHHYHFINSHDFYLNDIAQQLPRPVRSVYHCIDPIVKAYSARHGHYLEAAAAREADVVVTTSPYLRDKMQAYHANAHCVPNAANFALSHQATRPETPVHAEVAAIPAPRIGYIGNIERRIAYDWLSVIFRRQPHWQLVMVGPRDAQFVPADFFDLPNVYWIAPVAHARLPSVLKGFDVALIPFKKDEVSAQIYPLKLFEYMGSGKPVVTTNFNPDVIGPFCDQVHIGTTASELEQSISDALEDIDPARVALRLRTAAQNDWGHRAQQFIQLLDHDTTITAKD
jgi:glycosyltransferase involved in cell wall biosynthesis